MELLPGLACAYMGRSCALAPGFGCSFYCRQISANSDVRIGVSILPRTKIRMWVSCVSQSKRSSTLAKRPVSGSTTDTKPGVVRSVSVSILLIVGAICKLSDSATFVLDGQNTTRNLFCCQVTKRIHYSLQADCKEQRDPSRLARVSLFGGNVPARVGRLGMPVLCR